MIRLNKYLAQSGVASRREADRMIASGRVKVNWKVVTLLGTKVSPNDRVELDGNVVHSENYDTFIVLYKPAGYITTTSDEKRRPKVTDLVRTPTRVHPIGRLDADSEGLLILTNNGKASNRLLHPRFKVPKTYEVVVNKNVKPQDLKILQRGVNLSDGVTQPCKAEYISEPSRKNLRITIREGRNRQIRRMLGKIGYRVVFLKRTRFGSLGLGNLKPGEWRYLEPKEIKELTETPIYGKRTDHRD